MSTGIDGGSAILLRDWANTVPARPSPLSPVRVGLDALVRSGVPEEDIDRHRVELTRLFGLSVSLDQAAHLLFGDLWVMHGFWPSMPTRVALGWLMVCRSVERTVPEGVPTGPMAVVETATSWAAAGLREDGWLFHAAGLTLAEAKEMLAAGIVDRSSLIVLAGLRDAALPSGVPDLD